jgi:hypothetical protein
MSQHNPLHILQLITSDQKKELHSHAIFYYKYCDSLGLLYINIGRPKSCSIEGSISVNCSIMILHTVFSVCGILNIGILSCLMVLFLLLLYVLVFLIHITTTSQIRFNGLYHNDFHIHKYA